MAKQLLTSYPNEEWTAILTQKVSFWQIESNTLVKPKKSLRYPIRTIRFGTNEHWFTFAANNITFSSTIIFRTSLLPCIIPSSSCCTSQLKYRLIGINELTCEPLTFIKLCNMRRNMTSRAFDLAPPSQSWAGEKATSNDLDKPSCH